MSHQVSPNNLATMFARCQWGTTVARKPSFDKREQCSDRASSLKLSVDSCTTWASWAETIRRLHEVGNIPGLTRRSSTKKVVIPTELVGNRHIWRLRSVPQGLADGAKYLHIKVPATVYQYTVAMNSSNQCLVDIPDSISCALPEPRRTGARCQRVVSEILEAIVD